MHIRPGLTERGEMEKSGNSYYSFGEWASQNQHVDIREKTGNNSNKTCPFGYCVSCHQPHVENIWRFDTKYSDIQPLGAVLDTGAQRGATGTSTEILSDRDHSEYAASRRNSKENDGHSHGC